jgi:hypothetical protein
MAVLPDPGRSRAVLIGASTYRHLDDLPAVRNNLSGIRDALVAPAQGGLPADKCMVVAEPAAPVDVYRALREQAAAAEDTLLVYFAGHGRTGSRNELWLCLPSTDPDELPYSAWPYDELRRVVAGSRATKKVVILDCCFSGRAMADQAGDEETILGQVGIEGTYLLTATAANAVALAPPGEPYTAFTGTLLGLINEGIPEGPELLTFGHIFPRLRNALTSRQLPQPRQQGSDTITHLALTRNLAFTAPAAKAQADAEAGPSADTSALLARAAHAARWVTGQSPVTLPPGTEGKRVAGFGRLEDGLRQASDWYLWGPYVSERQWGTVREDYSAEGDAWAYVPHDHARSRAYRWGEDGLAGFCDIEQRLCLGLALWNGRDPILKERAFGLSGAQGNHGEDVKEYWWYLDAVPSHSWNRWRYHYPQRPFPYQDLLDTNARRDRYQPEYELLDTGVFDDDRYWVTEVSYAKADPTDVLMAITVTNAGPDADTLHVLPTAWFRNTWAWDRDAPKPAIEAAGGVSARIEHPFLGTLELLAGDAPGGTSPVLLFCENETNLSRLYGAAAVTPYPKDGINDHVINHADSINPERRGTKCAFWYTVEVPSGGTVELRLRLRPRAAAGKAAEALGQEFERVISARRAEADEFYAGLTPEAASPDEGLVMRQAFSGLLWGKQFYHYDVARWLDGDPTQPAPPPPRFAGRNSRWRHFNSLDIMSVPDKWEYPWFATWDLGFHCVALARLDPGFAKYQLTLLCREWFQHPNGALPAYEWDFSDVNPPVQAWAALQVFVLDGCRDLDYLDRVFDQLLVNFTWWLNREDAEGNTLFEGGFLTLDNIGPVDRSRLPVGGTVQQSDANGWLGFYALEMASMAVILLSSGQRRASDTLLKLLGHFAAASDAVDSQGLWDNADGFYYDRLLAPSGIATPMKVRSLAGIIPMLTSTVIDEEMLEQSITAGRQFANFLNRQDLSGHERLQLNGEPGHQQFLLSVIGVDQLRRLFARLFDENEFLSPHGLRALSAYHRDHPYTLDLNGTHVTIDYQPGESTTSMFGGNSNWRGPLWFPLNFLVLTSLERYHRFLGGEFTLEYPTGSGVLLPLDAIAADLQDRLISIFTRGPDGRRPCFGGVGRLQTDPAWKDNLAFSEYFHGDNAAGLGASHQTGWTGLVADTIIRRHSKVSAIDNMIHQGPGVPTQY